MKRSLISARARALWLAATLCAGLPAQTALAQVRLPALGEAAAEEFSLSTERSLGLQIMREIRRDPDYLDDPPLLDYLNSVWKPLLEAARQRGEITPETAQLLAWEVFLVRDRSVNAFALPGGYVGVHLGLIAITGSGDELAAVLAHELSHVTQRHIARGIVNTQRTTLLSLAGLILGVLAASRSGSAEATQAAVVGAQAGAIQSQLNYSRDMEREADRVGYGVLTEAGFSASGMAAMFEKLESANRLNDNGAFPYLRSHPLTVERISEARARLTLAGAAAPSDPLQHLLMGARARVLMDSSMDGLRRQQQRLGSALVPGTTPMPPNERLAALYAGALASLLLRDTAGGEAAVSKALELLRGRATPAPAAESVFKLLQAQLWLQRGDATAAVRLLDSPAFQPASRSSMLLRAQAAMGLWHAPALAGQPRCAPPPQAQGLPQGPDKGASAPPDTACDVAAAAVKELRHSSEALQTWLSIHANDALAWGLLAQAEEALGQRLRAMRAQAEARAALGDTAGAIDRLRAAQALVRSGAANDFIEASVIDARLRQLEAMRREISAELRGKLAGLREGAAPH
ncbi:MAG TPA: M48 family metalloprotease [Rubrivivax sp.]|nr:M48 family metalloprotease [Rubrivivax sp.]